MEEKHLYQKVINRSLSLISAHCWYLGERFGLAELTEGAMYFEPLFMYEKGKGVGAYYDFTDPQQDNRFLLEYFDTHHDGFEQLIAAFEKDCEELLLLIDHEFLGEFSAVFKLYTKILASLDAIMIIGDSDGSLCDEAMTERARAVRGDYENITYVAEEYLLKLAKSMVPLSYAEAIEFLLPEEIINYELPQAAELAARKNEYKYFKTQLMTDVSLDELCRQHSIFFSQENEAQDEIRGMAAHRGVARGQVAVVYEFSQLAKVQEGDILVAPMTMPDFSPVMKKVVAFVTDEGGITCHAAIVARELGKPCIIGTKRATALLKDGDIVEVDADQGVVRIIERGSRVEG
jgi:phosphohistidine swiveling domain-containing protein